ncbi:MAG: 50S ribosomal protein L35ae [Nanoarchaeota archaeon]
MEGVINNFCRNRHTCSENQMIVLVDSLTKRADAMKLVGKKVVYNTGKKDMIGKIASAHGNKGALRVIFETGMPGQAFGKKVKIE